MSSHDLVNWSLDIHNRSNEPDLDDAASAMIEKFIEKQDELEFDCIEQEYAYLEVGCRRNYQKAKIRQASNEPLDAIADIPEETDEENELLELMYRAIKYLSKANRQVIDGILRYLTIEEIAEELELSVACVYKRYERAIEFIKMYAAKHRKSSGLA